MNPDSSRAIRCGIAVLVFLQFALLLLPASATAENETPDKEQKTAPAVKGASFEEIAQALATILKEKHVKRVVVLDFVALNGQAAPVGHWFGDYPKHSIDTLTVDVLGVVGQPTPFGAWLADRLSADGGWAPIVVLDRRQLAAELGGLRTPDTNEFDAKKVKNLSLSQDAAVVAGSYTAADNGIGVTVASAAWGKELWSTIRAKIELTDEIKTHLPGPLESLVPPDGIYSEGQGGVTRIDCLADRGASIYTSPAEIPVDFTIVDHTDGHISDISLRKGPQAGFPVDFTIIVHADGHISDISPCQGPVVGCKEALAFYRHTRHCEPAVDIDGRPVATRVSVRSYYLSSPLCR